MDIETDLTVELIEDTPLSGPAYLVTKSAIAVGGVFGGYVGKKVVGAVCDRSLDYIAELKTYSADLAALAEDIG